MAKKNWKSVCQNERRYTTNTEQITWESSSSEDELNICHGEKTLNLTDPNCNYLPKKNVKQCNDDNSVLPHSSGESPIIMLRSFAFKEISPELSQRTVSIYTKSLSPVIEKRRYLRIKKRQKARESLFKKREKSPELFDSDLTQNIENESPIYDSSDSQATIKIDPFLSQFGSAVEQDSVKENLFLYYQPPKRKKTYKKGGVAHQLQNILKYKKSRTNIWHHEKLKNMDSPLDKPEDIVRLRFKCSWTEYGVTLLECDLICESSCGDENENFHILVNLGVNKILNVEFKFGDIYELYPPYNKSSVIYRDKEMIYYCNVSKIIKIG